MNRALLLLLLLSLPASAQESISAFFQREMPGYTLHNARQSGGWALCTWSYGSEAEGMALLHRAGDRWEVATSGGGALGAGELAQFGVPESRWLALLGRQPSSEELQAAEERLREPSWTWLTSKKKLTDDDLEGASAWELTLMRNEIFALHGRPFQDAELRAYFNARPWYRPNQKFSESSLTSLERSNAAFIMDYQRRTGKL